MSSDIKKSEIEVYDSTSDTRPEYNAYWDDAHHEALLQTGPEGYFRELLQEYADEGRILVLGCGTGGTVSKLLRLNSDREVVGIELSSKRLAEAAEITPDGYFTRADAEDLPFAEDSFDAVVAHSILHHLPNWKSTAIAEIKRVTKSGGSLIYYEPGRYNPPAAFRRRFLPSKLHTPDEHPFDPSELERVLQQHFEQVEMDGHCLVSNVLPVVWNTLPFSVPTDVTTNVYRMEKSILQGTLRRFAWLLTGVAKDP